MDVNAVAAELYGLAPADFTKIRDQRASEAKTAGDRELARAIGKLRRPGVGAWLANLLVRERGDQVQSMLDLGAAIRRAQAQSAKDELRKLQSERRRAIAALLGDAAELGRHRGESVSPAATRDLEATLEAALLNLEAAKALKAGRLTTGLRYAGLGWPGAPDDPFLSAGTTEPETKVDRAESSGPGLPQPGEQLRSSAGEAQRETEAHLTEAKREADEGKRRLEEAARDLDIWRRKVADLEQQLGYAQEEARKAEHRIANAHEAIILAEQGLGAAETGVAEKNSD